MKRYKTCHAIYWQKARIKRKDIDGSECLTGICVCQWVNMVCGYVKQELCKVSYYLWHFIYACHTLSTERVPVHNTLAWGSCFLPTHPSFFPFHALISIEKVEELKCISMFHCAFFNSIIDKYQHMHFTLNNILV